MHEHSIIHSLLDQVRDIAQQNSASAVTEVVVAVGPLSGVEPLLLDSAFQQLATNELLRRAQLTIEKVPLTVQCDLCGRQSVLNNFVFACPHCGTNKIQVVGGEGIMLRHVMLQVPLAEEAGS